MKQHQRTLVDWTLRSLDREPENWTTNRYEAIHEKTGVRVWIGNGPSCVQISIGDNFCDRNAIIGDVCMLPWFSWQRSLYRKAKGLQQQRLDTEREKLVRKALS